MESFEVIFDGQEKQRNGDICMYLNLKCIKYTERNF